MLSHPVSDIRELVIRLTDGVDGALNRAEQGSDSNLSALLKGLGGWNIVEVLKTASACALAKGLPADHPDVALLRDLLKPYGFC
jgi:hypothetical protein